jgi:hypothetical protein
MGPLLRSTPGPALGPGSGPGSGPVPRVSAKSDVNGKSLECMELDELRPSAPSFATLTSCRPENDPFCRGEGRATPAWRVAMTQRRAGAGSARRGRSPLHCIQSQHRCDRTRCSVRDAMETIAYSGPLVTVERSLPPADSQRSHDDVVNQLLASTLAKDREHIHAVCQYEYAPL